MKLIELYLEEIRHQLPPRNRDDILREIRSTLMDMVEDRNPNPGESPDEAIVKAVLKDFGPPREVASQYGPQNYLVGPRMFPIYIKVLRIVLIVIAALNILGLIVAIVSRSGYDAGLLDAILQVVGGLFGSLFTAFGIVTLSFAAIERTTPEDWKVKVDQAWQPEDLLKQEDKERVKIAEMAIEIILSLVFIALMNFFLDRIGIYYLGETGWVSAPLLNENFLRYIPWITAYSILDIALDLYLIRMGFWNKYATIAKLLINAFKIAVTFVIITGPAIITIDATAWQTLNLGLDSTPQTLSNLLNTILDVLMGLSIFGLVVDSIKRLYIEFIKGSHASIEFDAK